MNTLEVPLILPTRGRRNSAVDLGRVPRISRLMAAAIQAEEWIQTGQAVNYADLARRFDLTRARVTQVMNLLHLAPDLQEEILFLPRITQGRDPITLRDVLAMTAELDWKRQRSRWAELRPQPQTIG